MAVLLGEVLSVQVALRQPVLFDHGRHAPFPLQVPSFEQSPPSTSLAVQRFLGSLLPESTNEHLPTLLATLQLLHRPPVAASLQAESQQTPSVQNLLWHWVALVQAAPLIFSPQELFTQVFGAKQSASEVQVVLQAVPEQMNVPQEWLLGVTQSPYPLHFDSSVSDDPEVHTAGLHCVPVEWKAHAPFQQAPVEPQVSGRVARHFSWGSGAPFFTAVHDPSEDGRLHALHDSLQAKLQQTP